MQFKAIRGKKEIQKNCSKNPNKILLKKIMTENSIQFRLPNVLQELGNFNVKFSLLRRLLAQKILKGNFGQIAKLIVFKGQNLAPVFKTFFNHDFSSVLNKASEGKQKYQRDELLGSEIDHSEFLLQKFSLGYV